MRGDRKKEVRYEPDTQLRDFENIILKQEIVDHVRENVLRHVADAWADRSNIRSAYEINFNRHFYKYTPPRPLAEIDADLLQVTDRIKAMIGGLAA